MDRNKKIPESCIIDALGNHMRLSEASKCRFAKAVVEDAFCAQQAGDTPYPIKSTRIEVAQAAGQLATAARHLNELSNEHPFIKAMVGVTARAGTDKGYRLVELDGVVSFAEFLEENVAHERFDNLKRGRDTRLAQHLANMIAGHYRKILKRKPGATSAVDEKRGAAKRTPFQRVCDVVAEHTGVTIGKTVQANAIKNTTGDKPRKPYFRPE